MDSCWVHHLLQWQVDNSPSLVRDILSLYELMSLNSFWHLKLLKASCGDAATRLKPFQRAPKWERRGNIMDQLKNTQKEMTYIRWNHFCIKGLFIKWRGSQMLWKVMTDIETDNILWCGRPWGRPFITTLSTKLTSGDSGSLILVVFDFFILLCENNYELLLPPQQLSNSW